MNDKVWIYSTSAFSAIVIFKAEDDYVQTAYYYDGELSSKGRNKIRYDEEGKPYFTKYGVSYYLENFVEADASVLEPKERVS